MFSKRFCANVVTIWQVSMHLSRRIYNPIPYDSEMVDRIAGVPLKDEPRALVFHFCGNS